MVDSGDVNCVRLLVESLQTMFQLSAQRKWQTLCSVHSSHSKYPLPIPLTHTEPLDWWKHVHQKSYSICRLNVSRLRAKGSRTFRPSLWAYTCEIQSICWTCLKNILSPSELAVVQSERWRVKQRRNKSFNVAGGKTITWSCITLHRFNTTFQCNVRVDELTAAQW